MRLIFVGTPPNAAQALEGLSREHEIALVITRPDAETGRKRELKPSAVADKALELGLELLKTNKLTSEHLAMVADTKADLAIVVAYGALIPESFLAVMPWWNLHFSLLPQWRGATPLQHSMLSGGVGAGISLFCLDKGMDTGPLISQKAIQLDYAKTCGELLGEFTDEGVKQILEALVAMPKSIPQSGDPSLAPKISRADARVDWSAHSNQIMWQIMALNPEPGAWCELDGNPLKLLKAKSMGGINWNALSQIQLAPGGVEVRDGKVLVACAEGTLLELLEVQPAGKKPMPADQWARGLNQEVTLG